MKKLLLGLLLGLLLDRAVFSLGMHLGQNIVAKCSTDDQCYEDSNWNYIKHLTYYYP